MNIGVCVSEQYAGKGTGMTAAAKIKRFLTLNEIINADGSIGMGLAIEHKRMAQTVPWRLIVCGVSSAKDVSIVFHKFVFLVLYVSCQLMPNGFALVIQSSVS